jgi:hypothetical protein
MNQAYSHMFNQQNTNTQNIQQRRGQFASPARVSANAPRHGQRSSRQRPIKRIVDSAVKAFAGVARGAPLASCGEPSRSDSDGWTRAAASGDPRHTTSQGTRNEVERAPGNLKLGRGNNLQNNTQKHVRVPARTRSGTRRGTPQRTPWRFDPVGLGNPEVVGNKSFSRIVSRICPCEKAGHFIERFRRLCSSGECGRRGVSMFRGSCRKLRRDSISFPCFYAAKDCKFPSPPARRKRQCVYGYRTRQSYHVGQCAGGSSGVHASLRTPRVHRRGRVLCPGPKRMGVDRIDTRLRPPPRHWTLGRCC